MVSNPTVVPPQLCPLCSCIELPDLYERQDWVFEHASVQDLLYNASQGCQFCKLLNTSLGLGRNSDTPSGSVALRILCGLEHAPHRVRVYWEEQSGGKVLASSKLKLCGPEDVPEYEPDSAESFNVARDWLSNCVRNHSCGLKGPTTLPTRVLDVGEPDADVIRLYMPPRGTEGLYAALSYCWGPSNTFVTTSDNIESLMHGFQVSLLPRTLSDAVHVTRQLGLRYLWVDALCIIQGYDELAMHDWVVESSRMESVYSLAYITVSAAASSDCRQGLFYARSCALPQQRHNAGDKEEHVSLTLASARSFKDEPANSRAWTLQERLLSPRLLTYTTSEVFWQCDCGITREPHRKPFSNVELHKIYTYRLPSAFMSQKPDWRIIVESFCARNLTYSSDKLPAIAGLAWRYQASTGDRYLAGLWASYLLPGLLWVRDDNFNAFYAQARAGKPDGYRAPSWSWASVDGIVSFMHSQGKKPEHFKVTGWNAETLLNDPEDPFGRVVGGSLRIKGPLKRVRRLGWLDREQVDIVPKVFALSEPENSESEFMLGNAWVDDLDEKGIQTANEAQEIYLLLVAKDDHFWSLILITADDRPGFLQRVGLCCSYKEDQFWWYDDMQEETVTIV